MRFTFAHNNINVLNLDRSLAFYRKALGLAEVKRLEMPGFTLVYLGDGTGSHLLELTWLHERKEPYNLGDNEIHLAFFADDLEAAYALHKSMDCISFENKDMGLYFITDPDGYWSEIMRGPA